MGILSFEGIPNGVLYENISGAILDSYQSYLLDMRKTELYIIKSVSCLVKVGITVVGLVLYTCGFCVSISTNQRLETLRKKHASLY
jgi:hypothetical protein